MEFERLLDVYLRSRFTLMVLVTVEEKRALQAIKVVCSNLRRPLYSWDCADGYSDLPLTPGAPKLSASKDPLDVLENILKGAPESAVVLLNDFHDLWGQPVVKRKLRNVAQKLETRTQSIIVITPTSNIPNELRDQAVIIDFPAPTPEELNEILADIVRSPNVQLNLTDLGREKLIKAALGFTAAQARRVLAKTVVGHGGTLDERAITAITEEKKQVIRESQALEFYSPTETLDDVGGFDALKKWLRLREQAFSDDARDYGLPAPKGIALIGIPGTGKSLTAKTIGNLWNLPLLRLDMGGLFGSLVGESEERTRSALRLAETIAPSIVWIDEIEKGIASGDLDGGTSQRVFSTILTWMQEKTAPCFVVATANDIERLPPELLRKGRFDEVFFLDLPTFKERKEIFAVHLRKKGRLMRDFDIDRLARESESYVGSEIEQVIIDALYSGYNEGKREITTEDIIYALKHTIPLAKTQKEKVSRLRAWLKDGRAKPASFPEVLIEDESFTPLQIESA